MRYNYRSYLVEYAETARIQAFVKLLYLQPRHQNMAMLNNVTNGSHFPHHLWRHNGSLLFPIPPMKFVFSTGRGSLCKHWHF
jgi:hypothetical protein